jgi:hypothetical protein
MNRLSFFAICACLIVGSGARAQYNWHVVHHEWGDKKQFAFTAVDCYGENCTAAAEAMDTSMHPPVTTLFFYRSNDGGLTWTVQDPGLPHQVLLVQNHFVKVQQIDSLNVVAIGDTGLMVKTTDAGVTWQRVPLPTTYDLFDVHFSDPLTGIVVVNFHHQVLTTLDGGQHWKATTVSGFLPPKQCHSYGSGKFLVFPWAAGPIYTTADNFQSIDSSLIIYPLTDSVHNLVYCNFLGVDTIVAYGTRSSKDPPYSRLLMTRSIDGGKSWKEIPIPDSNSEGTGWVWVL